MKRFVLAAILTLSSLGCFAQKWVMIDEAKDGSLRLLVDSDSWTVSTDAGRPFLVAPFRYVSNGVPGEINYYITEAAACKNRSGQLFQREVREGKWTTVNQYWWSKNGNKLYDSIGMALCDIFEVRIEENKQEKKSKDPATSKTL